MNEERKLFLDNELEKLKIKNKELKSKFDIKILSNAKLRNEHHEMKLIIINQNRYINNKLKEIERYLKY